MTRRAVLACALGLLAAAVTLPAQQPAFAFLQTPPRGLPPMPVPDAPKPTPAMFDLGQRLFADPILSRDRKVSCQTCHQPELAFASSEPIALGIDGRRGSRNAPSLLNRGYGKSQRWNGRNPTLESFVLEPIADPLEMDLPVEQALQRLRDDPSYRDAFAAAFPAGVTGPSLATALATFVRGIAAGDAAYDRFLAGEVEAMTREARAGQWLFESKAACWQCHTPPLFTDEDFHATGVGVRDGLAEPGRAEVTGEPADRGRFKTPGLRGIARSAPYMHDGSLRSLEEVVDFYARGGNAHPERDRRLRPVDLSAAERANLVAFLKTL